MTGTVARKRNIKVRDALQQYGVAIWQLAESMGLSDSTFYAKIRREQPEEIQTEWIRIIEQIASEQN